MFTCFKAAVKVSALICMLVQSSDVAAINFVLNYTGPDGSNPVDPRSVVNPEDPGGLLLTAHMQAAADDWADIVEDNFTMSIDYYYAGASDVPTLTANAPADTVTPDGRRTLTGRIQFYVDRDWWFDPTPTNDLEFNLSRTIVGELPAAEQAAQLTQVSGNTHALEVGYRGSPNGSVLVDGADTLSAARHELGHHMGVTNQLPQSLIETNDGAYDLPPGLNGGAVLEVHTGPDTTAHLGVSGPLMSSDGGVNGERRGISAVDVLSAASVSNWTQINLKRIDFMGSGTSFGTSSDWAGSRVPSPLDWAYIRHGGLVTLTANDVVGQLHVAGGSNLTTLANTLAVQGKATIGVASGGSNHTAVTANAGGTFTAREIVIESGELQLTGGLVSSQSDITNNAIIRGSGTILLLDDFSNSGTILATGGGTLVIDELVSGTGARVDLDGSGSGRVFAVSGNIDVNLPPITQNFTGEMTIGAGRFIDMDSDWRLQGDLTLDGNGSQAAELRGGNLTVSGDVVVDQRASLDVEIDMDGNGNIHLPQGNDQITFGGNVTITGGSLTGAGSHVYNGDLSFGFGSLEAASIDLNENAVIQGGNVSVPLIDTTDGAFIQSGGSLTFEQLDGKYVQTGGNLILDQAIIDGTYQQLGGGTLAVEIGGMSQGESSFITVTQDAELLGELSVSLANGYEPMIGDQFLVLIADNIVDFELTLAGPAGNAFQLLLQGDSIVLEAIDLTLLGDFNDDGIVDAADYTVWRDNLGAPNESALNGNGDGIGGVDQADYALWKSNFGTASASSTSQLASTVPEPSMLLLLVFCGILLSSMRLIYSRSVVPQPERSELARSAVPTCP